MKSSDTERLASLFYEIGTLRKVMRAHQQRLLTTDPTDTIAAHSFRTATIGLFLASQFDQDIDILKVIIMCLLHDFSEVRANDHHWVQKRYVRIFEQEILTDQFSDLPGNFSVLEIMQEYEERKSLESQIAKDADLLDQLLLMKEYEQQGNKQAGKWLSEADGLSKTERLITTSQAKAIASAIRNQDPGDWTLGLATSKRR